MGLKIQVFRRWCLDEPLEGVLRGLRDVFAWAGQQGSGVAQLRMKDYLYDRRLGIVGLRVPVGDDYFWRLCFETAHQGMVCIEVCNKSTGVFSWVKYLHYVLVHGLEYSEVKSLRLGYRKDLRVQLGRSLKAWDGVDLVAMVHSVVDSTVILACEYLGLLSCHKVFAKVSSARMRMGACRSKCVGFDDWVSGVNGLLYEPWESLAGSTQPEEVIEILQWLQMYYETVYRKLVKVLGSDVDIAGVMREFTVYCTARLREVLGEGMFMWNNSFVLTNLNCKD